MIKGAQRAEGEGGGGVIWISSDRDDWMGPNIKTPKILRASSKPQKIPGPRLNPQKIPRQISEP